MALKIVHINKKDLGRQAEVKAFWENVLKPKWEAKVIQRGEKIRAELMGGKVPPDKPRA